MAEYVGNVATAYDRDLRHVPFETEKPEKPPNCKSGNTVTLSG
ncbi:hypothetical protein [Nitrosomonas sp. HPC101]|nr:hypothetical protein [Nitrosomonas sp. HPC101]